MEQKDGVVADLFTVTEFRDHEDFIDDPPTDNQITELIQEWQSWLERATGQFFDPRTLEFSMDGSGNALLQLPLAIIEIEWIKINDSISNLSEDEYAVYKGRQEPNDDRMNPRIKLKPYRANIFTDPGLYNGNGYQSRMFIKGVQNQLIKGEFGFVEPGIDKTPPLLILKALRRLVLRGAQKIAAGGSPSSPSGSGGSSGGTIIEEWTDGHKYKLADIQVPPTTLTSSGDPEVDRIVMMYRRPIAIGSPRNG